MYKCRKCGMKFKTATELKNHEFDCVNYIMQQSNELEEVRKYFKNKIMEFNYEVKPNTFKDYEDIIHKSIHFKLHIKFKDSEKINITDEHDLLKSGHLNKAEDIVNSIEEELKPKQYSNYEKAMIEYYSNRFSS